MARLKQISQATVCDRSRTSDTWVARIND